MDSTLEATIKKVTDRLDRWDHDALLNAAQTDVAEELTAEATVECPRLLRDQAWMLPMSEAVHRFTNYVGDVERPVPQLTLVVPFEGEKDVFRLRPRQFTPNLPRRRRAAGHRRAPARWRNDGSRETVVRQPRVWV